MTCAKCGRALKLHRSKCNGKREVWGCRGKECDYLEDFPLWGPARLEDREAKHQTFGTSRIPPTWFWDGNQSRTTEEAA